MLLILYFILIIAIINKTLSFCEDSYVVICDELEDIKHNDTTQWEHLQIGSPTEYKSKPADKILTAQLTISLNKVKSLTIINKIKAIQTPFTIAAKTYYEHINFFGNDINHIEDYTFQNLQTLQEVYLKNNKIAQLGRGIFRNTTLKTVDLSRNKIGAITTCFLFSEIKKIVINYNQINYIGQSPFPRTLEQLHLDHNLIKSLDSNVLYNLYNLKELSIKNNRLTAVPDISQLKAIRFLHFAGNSIRFVNNLMDHKDLEYVDLSSNLIKNISLNIFGTKKVPPLVLLTYNRLTDLKFDYPENKTDLVLYGNPWNCNCLFHIENITQQYKHFKSCDFEYFKNGQLPMCIENGACGKNEMDESDIDNFIELVGQNAKTTMCNFYL